jgi:hypothetical protein
LRVVDCFEPSFITSRFVDCFESDSWSPDLRFRALFSAVPTSPYIEWETIDKSVFKSCYYETFLVDCTSGFGEGAKVSMSLREDILGESFIV